MKTLVCCWIMVLYLLLFLVQDLNGVEYVLTWEGPAEISRYTLEISKDNRFRTIEDVIVVSDNYFKMDVELRDPYYVRISGIQGESDEVVYNEIKYVYLMESSEGLWQNTFNEIEGTWYYQNYDAYKNLVLPRTQVDIETRGDRILFYEVGEDDPSWQGNMNGNIIKATWQDGILMLMIQPDLDVIEGIWERNNGNIGLIYFERE